MTTNDLTARLSDPEWRGGDARRRTAHWLSDVNELAALATSTEALLYDTVGQARDDGVTWELIGRALGVSRSGAQQRFSKAPPGRLV
jgi:hypothetical protein